MVSVTYNQFHIKTIKYLAVALKMFPFGILGSFPRDSDPASSRARHLDSNAPDHGAPRGR